MHTSKEIFFEWGNFENWSFNIQHHGNLNLKYLTLMHGTVSDLQNEQINKHTDHITGCHVCTP